MNTVTVTAGASGAVIGLGVWLLLMIRHTRPSLAERLADPPSPDSTTFPPASAGWLSRCGSSGVPLLSALGLPTAHTRARLAVCDRTPDSYLAEKTAAGLVAITVPPLLATVLTLAGISITTPVAGGLWAVFALICWLAPDLALRNQAERNRDELRHAAAAFADLVVISLAGGAGVNGALQDASQSGTGWAMSRIRAALHQAALRREAPWQALGELGARYDVAAFDELAASLRLAGADGARVRASLSAKAHTLRTQHLAQLEADAHSATERMSLPVVLLFAGFLIMIGYPALSLITTTL
ncbi:type II secretion system (T2SS) protein F [Haloactinospora alba]|uniref:Type II secretion system (T2SS) protein F n=1 Tax=Haloactinospora alba TaxID=405555 RepID=A0A543NLI0_9ACTN|nr:type II secretion system F family protein [Haloactinospora alba]TQN32666.1 type II secretion system (T2SS) protein F [Haloactinospora alba]